MLRKRIVVWALAAFLLAVPLAGWLAYDWAYHGDFAFKTHRWLSDVGRHLRLIAAAGACVWLVAWGALLHYAMKPPPANCWRNRT